MTGPTNVDQRPGGALAAISSTLVALHKEQFGRGPTRARSNFAGDDTLVCVLEDALLPAERVMVQMGDQQRVRESRAALQAATSRAVHQRDRGDPEPQGDGVRERDRRRRGGRLGGVQLPAERPEGRR